MVVNIERKLYIMLGKIIGYNISYIPARVFPLLTFNTVLKVCDPQVRFNL